MRFLVTVAAMSALFLPAPAAFVNGPVAKDRTIACPLPGELHKANISSKGLGCCVFRSLDHAARWQNVPALYAMPEWMVSKGVAGGGWPEKVDDLVPRIAKDRGLPVPEYVQIEENDLEILKLATRTRRMVCVTYARSPTGRYNGARIAHMVNAVHTDDEWSVVLDNNYIGTDRFEWIELPRVLPTYSGGSKMWAIVLLAPPPPPEPK